MAYINFGLPTQYMPNYLITFSLDTTVCLKMASEGLELDDNFPSKAEAAAHNLSSKPNSASHKRNLNVHTNYGGAGVGSTQH